MHENVVDGLATGKCRYYHKADSGSFYKCFVCRPQQISSFLNNRSSIPMNRSLNQCCVVRWIRNYFADCSREGSDLRKH
jgi:hypothetical protein